jgi:hypothetical protein
MNIKDFIFALNFAHKKYGDLPILGGNISEDGDPEIRVTPLNKDGVETNEVAKVVGFYLEQM